MGRRRIAVVLVLCTVVVGAATLGHGYAKRRVWQQWERKVQLGYLSGYFDGISGSQRKDLQSFVIVAGKRDYARWLTLIDEYFEDPAHAQHSIPQAIAQVSFRQHQARIQAVIDQRRRAYREKKAREAAALEDESE